jgi:flagellin-like hook-associated protein FlgL
MRSIIVRELAANYKVLMQVSGTREGKDAPAEHPLLVMRNMLRLSTRVYDQYLGRLDQLTPDEVSDVYDAYVSVARLAALGSELTDLAADSSSREGATTKARTSVHLLDRARDSVAAALRTLGAGQAELQSAEAERGSVYRKLAEVRAQLS